MQTFKNDVIKRYIILSFALFISASNYNLFSKPFKIVSGGTNGIALVIENIFNIDSSLTILIICGILLIFSHFLLKKDDTLAALFIAIIYPVFIAFTGFLSNIITPSSENIIFASILGGIFSGVSNGIIYKIGLNTGGIGIISKIISKKFNVSVSYINFILNMIIVLCGTYIFGFDMILYTSILLFFNKIVSDRVLLGISKNKAFYIFSDKYDKIESFVKNEIYHDYTELKIIDVKNNKKSKLVIVVVPNTDYFALKEGIKVIDPDSYVFISDSYETKMQDLKIKKWKDLLNNKKVV